MGVGGGWRDGKDGCVRGRGGGGTERKIKKKSERGGGLQTALLPK